MCLFSFERTREREGKRRRHLTMSRQDFSIDGIRKKKINICLNLDTRLEAILSKNQQHPRSLEEITKCTRFSKAEIRLLYRSFKQVVRWDEFYRGSFQDVLSSRNVQVVMLVKNVSEKSICNFFHKEVRA